MLISLWSTNMCQAMERMNRSTMSVRRWGRSRTNCILYNSWQNNRRRVGHYFIACTIYLYIHNRTTIASIRNYRPDPQVYLVLMCSSFVCHFQEPDSESAPTFLWELPPFRLIHQFFKNVGGWEVFVLLTQLVC